MIIWNGKGYLVAVIIFGCSLITELVSERIYQDDRYYQTHSVPLASAFLMAGIIIWIVGRQLNKQKVKTLVDKQTGEEVVLKNNNSFFFIAMEYWAPIMFLASLGVLFFKD